MAAEIGRRLLAEVQEVGLDEILQTVRLRHDTEPAYFGIPPLDKIVNTALARRTTTTANTPPSNPPPILELIPQAPGSGTTHFLYLLTATAILPSSLGGKDSCVAIIDTDNTFSITRLVQQLRVAIRTRDQTQHEYEYEPDQRHLPKNTETGSSSEKSTLTSALRHVHIFRPQSHPSLLATLASLPTYFLPNSSESRNTNNNKNQSAHRPLAFIALDSLPAFHWQTLAERETLAYEEEEEEEEETQQRQDQQQDPPGPKTTAPSPQTPKPNQTPRPKPTTLPQLLLTLLASFPSTPQIHTNPSHFPRLSSLTHQDPPRTIPLTFALGQTRPFPPLISLAEALRERDQREIAVRKAGWVVGSNISVPTHGGESGGGGMLGFKMGVDCERGVWVAGGG